MNLSKTSLTLILAVSMICFLLTPITSFAEIHKLTILHTSDHIGHFAKFSWDGMPDVGGMAARSTLVNIVRAEVEEAGGHVLLLSAGNISKGVPESDLFDAEPDFRLMKMLGYDAMALGYREFDGPREVLMRQYEWAGFPFLSANVVEKNTGKLPFPSHIVKEIAGLRVAIFGLTHEAVSTAYDYAKHLSVRNTIEAAQALVPSLTAEADLVIALSNIEFSSSGRKLRTPGDVQVAEAVRGIDVIVSGDAKVSVLEKPELVGDTLIVQSGRYGLYVGRLDLTFDDETNSISDYRYALLPVNLKQEIRYRDASYYTYIGTGYVEDPAVLEVIHPYLAQTEELLSQPVGETLVKLDGAWELVTTRETNLANLVTDAMRARTGAEIALQNGGGIQADIAPGSISYRDILRVHPWRSTLVLLDMTGTQIMDVLAFATTIKREGGGFLHASGLTWINNKGIPEHVLVGDAPIDSERTYKVVTNSFIAGGGDGYTVLQGIPHFDTGMTNAAALREYIMKLGTVAPKVEGRLTIIE